MPLDMSGSIGVGRVGFFGCCGGGVIASGNGSGNGGTGTGTGYGVRAVSYTHLTLPTKSTV